MTRNLSPEAIVLGALFDFAGHLRAALSLDPLKSVDTFAELRQLSTPEEVPTLTWRDQLNQLQGAPLPSDSELISDLLILAEAFKDGDPNADTGILDLLTASAVRLRCMGDLLADLELAAQTLRHYETLHRAKGTAESTAKAEVNAELATRFEGTLAKAKGEAQ